MYQLALPEAICITDPDPDILTLLPAKFENFTVVGAGPGLGKNPETRNMVRSVLGASHHRLVLDADALNIIAEDHLLQLVPENAVITPHVGEFTRLFGPCENDSQRIDLALKKAVEHHIYILLKGRHSLMATPDGEGYINITGNPGMAKGGSGDVLTGMLTGLLAQHYSISDACKLGVFCMVKRVTWPVTSIPSILCWPRISSLK
jgi:NAD(P)H-hydrate epimerase